MIRYVAFLRAITPSNPSMQNAKLRQVFASLGFADVSSLLSSGNILFSSDNADKAALEKLIDTALTNQLGIVAATSVRSEQDIALLIASNPFEDCSHSQETYLTLTFFRRPPNADFEASAERLGGATIVKGYHQASASLALVNRNPEGANLPFMSWMDKQFKDDITTRTWLTVQRVAKKLANNG